MREQAFSIVEVIVSVVVLAVVVAAATSVFSSSTRATSVARVRDKQTAVANEVMAKMQADASWALECKARQNPFNPARPDCDLTTWMQSQPQLRGLGLVRENNGTVYRFRISAIATGVDLQADKLGPLDTDGVLPDLYRLRITIAPDADLARRYQHLKATTLQQETNPTIRVQTGRVTVNACLVLNQVDERAAAGDCTGASSAADLIPPGALDTTSRTTIRNTCQGITTRTGSDKRDCVPYKCAEEAIAQPNPGLLKPCAAHGGWSQKIFSYPWSGELTSMRLGPARGRVTLQEVRGTRTFSQPLRGGTAQFRGLPVGSYRVVYSTPGYRQWKSKSVPSSNIVAVEAGLNSRAVLMFRPTARGRVNIKVRSVDSSGPPWMMRNLTGYVGITKDGRIVEGGTERLYLVPAPQGRLLQRDKPYADVVRSSSTTEFRFTNVEPGLYSFELSDTGYNSFKSVSNTAGFIYVFPNGTAYYGESSQAPEYVNGLCATDVRDRWVAGGPIADPDTGVIWEPQPCTLPGGPSPPSGGGGGGTA